SSGTTGATSQASEIAVGGFAAFDALSGFTAGYTMSAINDGAGEFCAGGYDILSSTGTQSLTATQNSSGPWAGAIATFKAAGSSVTTSGAVSMAKMSVAGSDTEANVASGAVSMSSLRVAGSELENVGATGAVSMSSLRVAGALTVTQSVFPLSPLDLEFDLYLGTSWVNVSTYVYQRSGSAPPVSITRGKPNESETTDPSTAGWEWNNQDGRFSPLNPAGAYYGQIARNTLVRISTQAANSYLRLENQDGTDSAFAQAAAATALNITGDLEFRVQLRLSDWTPCTIAGRWEGTESWSLNLENSGSVTFWWSPDGSASHSATSTVALPFSRSPFAIRVTFAVATGTATFYTSPTIDGTYTQLGSPVVFGSSTSLFAATGMALKIGYSANWVTNAGHFTLSAPTPYGAMHGRVYEARLYNGIGGTVVADGVFSALAAGTTTWSDPEGRSWSLSGLAEISGREYRFHGNMSPLPPTWDKTGRDMAVSSQASGLLRLLGQGSPP